MTPTPPAGQRPDDARRAGPRITSSTALQLVAVGRMAQQQVEAALAPHGLSLRLLGALGHLARTPGLSYSDLARRAGITTQSMHATVAQLVEAGAVDAGGAGQGRRSTLVVTAAGHELLAEAARALEHVDESLLGDTPAGDRAALTGMLARMARAAVTGD